MFESKKSVNPIQESKPKLETRNIQETMQMIEIKQKPEPKLEQTPSIVQTIEETTNSFVEENPTELTPSIEESSIVNIEKEREVSEEPDCFICKNKIKEERKLKAEQLPEQVEPSKIRIDPQEDLDDDPEEETNFLSQFLKLFQGFFS